MTTSRVVVGLSAAKSSHGKPLRDGAVAVIVDGVARSAVAEERVTRIKHQPGWHAALPVALRDAGVVASEVDEVAVSSCCDGQSSSFSDAEDIRRALPTADIIRVGHHESHAAYAFASSPFERALIVVSDAGGNTLGEDDPSEWWTAPREQTTFWVPSEHGVLLLGRDFDAPEDAGIGEIFRAATYYLGWPSQVHANKLMALAGCPSSGVLDQIPSPFYVEGGRIVSRIVNDPTRPVEMYGALDSGRLQRLVPPRTPDTALSPDHAALASHVQRSYEHVIRRRITSLLETHTLQHVCLGGGVAYNCRANATLATAFPSHVPPAPGDTGQALGNAVAAYVRRDGWEALDRSAVADPYLGPAATAVAPVDVPDGFVALPVNNLSSEVAIRVTKGQFVGVIIGRSEYGARALCHRSLLADPRNLDTKQRLNVLKKRGQFNPFGATILASAASQLLRVACPSPTMQHAWPTTPRGQETLAAAVHEDGTCRAQIVADDEYWIAAMLRELASVTGTAAVLNTSLNFPGDPIVQNVVDAFPLLAAGAIDALFTETTAYELIRA